MAEPSLIREHLAALAGQLPAPIVEELADGLGQTYRHHLSQGVAPDAAAVASIAEFGEPQVIVAAFTRASPAQRAARRLLAAGPAVGACWAAALVTSRAWTWPVPVMARILIGAALITVTGLLAAAALGKRYRPVGQAATAGCAGIAALDATLLIAAPLAARPIIWPLVLAMAASAARITFTARAIAPIITG
jgi:hypothetical protein